MEEKGKNYGNIFPSELLDGSGLKVGIAASFYYEDLSNKLLSVCKSKLTELNVERIEVKKTIGSFELPYLAKLLLSNCECDAVIALGVVIKGETKHDEFITSAVCSSLANLSTTPGSNGLLPRPIILGVLNANGLEDAKKRVHRANDWAVSAVTCARNNPSTHPN